MEWIWLNGRVRSAVRATVPVLDRAVQYGFGLFEVTRAYRGEPFRLADHLERMRRSARAFRLAVPYSDAAILAGARDLVARGRMADAYVRIVLTAGGDDVRPSLAVRALPYKPPSAAVYRRGAAVRLGRSIRDPRSPLQGHKTLNYLENILTLERARQDGFIDEIQVDPAGRLLEGAVSNLFLVRRGRLVTPTLAGVLPGITRAVLMEIAREAKIPVVQRDLKSEDLEDADEAFLTNALVEVMPVTRFGRRPVQTGLPGPMTRALQEAYRIRVERETKKP